MDAAEPSIGDPTSAVRRAPLRTLVSTFAFLLALFALTSPGSVNAVDVWPVIGEAAGLVELGTVDFKQLDPALVDSRVKTFKLYGLSGRTETRNKYGVGLHTGFIPAYLVAKVGALATGSTPLDVARFTAAFVNPLAGAAIGALLLAALSRLGFAFRTCVAVTLLTTVGTYLWPLTGVSYTDPLQTAWLTSVFLQALRARASQSTRDLHLLGLLALVACSTKLALAPLVACLCLIAVPAWRSAGRSLVALGGWGIATLVFQGLVSWVRFDDPFDTGYDSSRLFTTPVLDGLKMLFISPSVGLLWFFPLAPVAVWGSWRLWRRARWLILSIGAGAAAHLVFHARLEYVHAGYCLGPRYLLPLVPLAAPGLAAALEAVPFRARSWVLSAALLLSATWVAPMATVQYFLLDPIAIAVKTAGGTPRNEIEPLAAWRLLAHKTPTGPDRVPLAPFGSGDVAGDIEFSTWDNSGYQWWWIKPHPKLPLAVRGLTAGVLTLLLLAGGRSLLRGFTARPSVKR